MVRPSDLAARRAPPPGATVARDRLVGSGPYAARGGKIHDAAGSTPQVWQAAHPAVNPPRTEVLRSGVCTPPSVGSWAGYSFTVRRRGQSATQWREKCREVAFGPKNPTSRDMSSRNTSERRDSRFDPDTQWRAVSAAHHVMFGCRIQALVSVVARSFNTWKRSLVLEAITWISPSHTSKG